MNKKTEFFTTVSQEFASHIALLAKRFGGSVEFKGTGDVESLYIKGYFTNVENKIKFIESLKGIIIGEVA